MRKVLDYVKENKKIIIVVVLIVVLIGAVYLIDKMKKPSSQVNSSSSPKSATEIKLTGILSNIDGVGSTDVMINEAEGQILGVVIVCQGANNIMTRSNILNAVSTALKINKEIIAIYSMTV